MTIDYSILPEHMRDGARLYIENGIEPGSFMSAVICNDLMEAFGRADMINKLCMFDIVRFFYNEAPAGCHGSPATMDAWVKSGGLKGLDAEPERGTE